MKKKELLIIGLILITIVEITILIKFYNEKDKSKNEQINFNNLEITDEEVDIEEVKKVKGEIGATAEETIYEVKKEYDGREILAIKPTVQYKTVLAGILKNEMPTKNEIDNIDLRCFSKKGVWISENSRGKFLEILKQCGIKNLKIDNDGYLYKAFKSNNIYGIRLENLINSEDLIIIDISGRCFTRDEMTGEVVEYPFKDMDLFQVCERYEINGSKIIIITTNEVKNEDILEEILN